MLFLSGRFVMISAVVGNEILDAWGPVAQALLPLIANILPCLPN